MGFHSYRTSRSSPQDLYERLWNLHDRHPLPYWLNVAARRVLQFLRRLRILFLSQRKPYRRGRKGRERPVDRFEISSVDPGSPHSDEGPEREKAQRRFSQVHEVNQELRNDQGAWIAQPQAIYHGDGISIEEIGLRVTGYLAAYRATGDSKYLQAAQQGCDYLRSERIYADGHIRLQGHLVIDITYAFAGAALLSLYEHTGDDQLLETACLVGDRLVDYHISGSVNHAVTPVQLLAPLYQHTGNVRYRKEVRRRLFRTAVPMQMPYGGWLGHESWIWYHAMITKSLILGYVSLPFDIKHQSEKDRLAQAITAALNRFVEDYRRNGSFRFRPEPPLCETIDDEDHFSASLFKDGQFQQVETSPDDGYGHWNGYVLDALVTAYEYLDASELVPIIDRFGSAVASSRKVSRLEFDTLGAGRYLEYVDRIRNRYMYHGPEDERPRTQDDRREGDAVARASQTLTKT